jgi:hypothetical protein
MNGFWGEVIPCQYEAADFFPSFGCP